MSMALWVHTLEERTLTSHQDDHILLNTLAEPLDALCTQLGVLPLTQYFDYTDLNANMEFDDEGEAEEDNELDPETGWSYGIDDMTWFQASDGIATLTALEECLMSSAPATIPNDNLEDLPAEIRSCLNLLREPASRGGRFHLAVVM